MRDVTAGQHGGHRLAQRLFWCGVIITIACTLALSALGKNVLPALALSPTATAVPCGTTNVARNTNPVISSSNESSTFPPSNAVDGNLSTRWASAYSDPQWLSLDFGRLRQLCRVVLRWEAAYAKAYQIQSSSDNTNWVSVISTTTGDGGVDDWTGLNFTARYLRIYGTQRATAYGYSLWEVEAYEPTVPASATPGNASLPDLTIVSAYVEMSGRTGSCVTSYTPYITRVQIANIGSADAEPFSVSGNGTTQSVSGLAAGQSMTLDFPLASGSFTAVVDSANQIVESNKANNSYTRDVSVTPTPPPTCTKTPTPTPTGSTTAGNLPDLSGQVSSMTVFGSPNGCTLGTSVLVRNTGPVASGAFVIRVSNSNTTGASDTNVAGLAAGESRTIWVASSGGSGSTTTLVVDVTNVVVEGNESNNTSSAMLPVPTLPPSCTSTKTPTPTSTTGSGNLPDLVVLSMWAQQDPTANNGTCMLRQPAWGISVTVRNSGTAGAGSFVVDVAGVQKTVPAGLAAGESTTLWFPVSMSTARTATADATFLVAELNESNNTYTISPLPGTATRTGTSVPTCPPTPTTTPNPGNVPDLTGQPSSMTVFGSPNGCTLGTSVMVRNIGLAASGAFVVRVSYSATSSVDANVGPLAAGETRYVWTPISSGGGTATVVVDVTNIIVELNESNNTSSAMIPIPTLPPSCLTPTATHTATATRTRTTTATVTATRTATVTNTTGPGCGTLNRALGKPATASSNESAGTTPNLAVDGNTGTRWSSAHGVDPQWLRVDLGATTPICRVLLRWEAAYGSAYQIQTSNDGTTWTTIRSLTGQNGGVDDNTGLTGSGRYVRIYGTARATTYGYSLWELEVY
jgi:subtilase family serine protease